MRTGPPGGRRRYRFRPHTRVCLTALASAAFLTACSETEPQASAESSPVAAQVTDSAGVEIVRNGAEGFWGAGEREVEEVLRIGVVEGAEPYQLFDVSAVGMDDAGRIYVGNRGTSSVRVFDPNGRFLRELGGRGQGPGEFMDVSRLYLTPYRLWVRDDRQLRVTGFSYDWEVLGTWTFIHDGVISLYHKAPQGWLGLELRADEPRPVRPPPRTSHSTRRFITRATPAAGPEEEARLEDIVELPPRVMYATFDGTRWDWPLFQPNPQSGVDEEGRIFVSGGELYEVDVYSPEGALVRSVRRDVSLSPLGPEVADELVALARDLYFGGEYEISREAALRQFPEYQERVDWQASLPMPEHLPPTGRLLVSPDGGFWIERTDELPPARFEFEKTFGPAARRMLGARRSNPWDLFDPRGHFLGRVRLPEGFRPDRVQGLTVLGVERDSLGVEFVVAYRVVEA